MKERRVVIELETRTSAPLKAIRKLKGSIIYAEGYTVFVEQVQVNVIRGERQVRRKKGRGDEEEPIRGRIW